MNRFFLGLSRTMAVLGGIVLLLLVMIICVSVAGRFLNGVLHTDFIEAAAPGIATWLLDLGIGPVEGDFELVEAGIAFSIFAFMPLCQITDGHASVDIFTAFLPKRVQRVLRMLIEIIFAIALVIIVVQLKAGMDSKLRSGQTTLLLQFPIWWAYALSLFGAAPAAIVGCYMVVVRVVEAFSTRTIIDEMGAGH